MKLTYLLHRVIDQMADNTAMLPLPKVELEFVNMPKEGAVVTGFRHDGLLGMFVCEAKYKHGRFYMRRYTRKDKRFCEPVEVDGWAPHGLKSGLPVSINFARFLP